MTEKRKHFGLHWTEDINIHTLGPGDFGWVAFESNYSGGTFRVDHDTDTGDFHLSEWGGSYIDPWDREIGTFSTPLEAMMVAAEMHRDESAEGQKWEREMDEAMRGADEAEASGIYDLHSNFTAL